MKETQLNSNVMHTTVFRGCSTPVPPSFLHFHHRYQFHLTRKSSRSHAHPPQLMCQQKLTHHHTGRLTRCWATLVPPSWPSSLSMQHHHHFQCHLWLAPTRSGKLQASISQTMANPKCGRERSAHVLPAISLPAEGHSWGAHVRHFP
jgi:hypothetical protein